MPTDRPDQSYLEPAAERTIEGVAVYVAGTDDKLVSGRTLTIQQSHEDRWVGRLDTNLNAYASIQLELRFLAGIEPAAVTFIMGPRVRGETLIYGVGPAPR